MLMKSSKSRATAFRPFFLQFTNYCKQVTYLLRSLKKVLQVVSQLPTVVAHRLQIAAALSDFQRFSSNFNIYIFIQHLHIMAS